MQSAHSADELLANAKFTQPSTKTGASGVGAPALPKAQHVGLNPFATKIPHTSYSIFPYSTVGKIFFTDPQTGLNYVCSGAAVSSTNLSVVDAAGHCVINGGSGNDWYTNWVFCPQYFKGKTPYGCWVARQLWSETDWINSGSLEDDFGDAVVSPNSHGNIVSVVGGTGWAYGQSTKQSFSALGYPAASPFNGNFMYVCGPIKTKIISGLDDGTVIAITCSMTPGSSGGPWMISVNGAFGYVNGHNDFKFNNDSTHMYSPYYDSDWYAVFNGAQTS
jgi:V8-like Glu-specific endopeptidase